MAVIYKAIPVKIPNMGPVFQEVEMALRNEGTDTEAMFHRHFRTWSNKPSVTSRVTMNRNQGMGWVDTFPVGDEGLIQIIEWVFHGTKVHDIPSRGPWPLRYAGTFTPKTQPGVLHSFSGGKSGEVTTHGSEVTHPGIEPRRVQELINDLRRKRVFDRLDRATARGIQRSIAGAR